MGGGRLYEVKRGRQDRVGGEKLLIVNTIVEYAFGEFSRPYCTLD